MQPHERFHAGFLIQLLSFVPPTYLHACLLIEATDGPGRRRRGRRRRARRAAPTEEAAMYMHVEEWRTVYVCGVS